MQSWECSSNVESITADFADGSGGTLREIDVELERQRLKKRYAGMSDGELEKIGSKPGTLAEWATDLLREEMNKRGLEWGEQLAVSEYKPSPEISRMEGFMSKKDFVVLASRVISLYFIFWALDNLSYVPADAFELRHYSPLPMQEYLYKVHLIQLLHHLVVCTLFFIGAVWAYKCGPSLENFLSPPD